MLLRSRTLCSRGLFLVREVLLATAATALLAMVALLIVCTEFLSRPAMRRPGRVTAVPTSPPRASIILCPLEAAALEDSVRSVVGTVRRYRGRHQVIVVGPQSGATAETLAGFPEVRFLASDVARAADRWKVGVQAADGDIVVLLRDDVAINPGFLDPLLRLFEDPEVFAVVSSVETRRGHTDGIPTARTRAVVRHGLVRLQLSPWQETDVDPRPVLWASRGFSAYRRSGFLELGGFDPLFDDAETGDADLCFRAWKRGWCVLYDPRSTVSLVSPTHRVGETRCAADLLERDRLLFVWRNLGLSTVVRHHVSLAASLFGDASRGRLNLRPLRYALCCLAGVLRRRINRPAPSTLSDEEVFLRSSHRYFLKAHRAQPAHPDRSGASRGGASEMSPAITRPTTATESPALPSSPAHRRTSSRWPTPETRYPTRHVGHTVPTTRLRILLVFPHLPYPPTHGGAVRMWNVLRTLSARHQVDLLSFFEPNLGADQVARSVSELKRYCGQVRAVARQPLLSSSSLLDRTVHVEMFDCAEMHDALLDLVDRGGYDVVQFHKTEMGQYLIPKPAPVQILVEHVVFHLAYRRQFLKRGPGWSQHLMEYLKLLRYELGVCRRFDAVLTMGPSDARFLRSRLPFHRHILDGPNGVDADYYRFVPHSQTDAHDLLFVGHFDHSPNVDAVRFFLREVFPRVRAAVPDCRLFIVGPGPYSSIPEVATNPNVIATGLVDDTRPYLDRCAVFVAPILAGAGTRVKILEAMAAGIPVVSTALGAEGLDAVSGADILIADEPAAFADAIITLLRNPKLRGWLSTNAHNMVDTHYDWRIIGARLETIYRQLLDDRESRVNGRSGLRKGA